MNRPHEGLVLDGYRLLRLIGSGGFGEVWLCRSDALGGYHALKFIADDNPAFLEKEFHALVLYRREVARIGSPHLVPIEHINRSSSGLYYVMPLADGTTEDDPVDPSWKPLSLAEVIRTRAASPTWFSSGEIFAMVNPILDALQVLSDAGLVHRDVKPDNILFINGRPCLGDVSLLGADAAFITRRGTPGYLAPSWYVDGNPDMYGAAATLYSVLTGNLPDKMGRSAFQWPPQGESSLPAVERERWKRFHAVVLRATDETVAERYLNFTAMGRALRNAIDGPMSVAEIKPPPIPVAPLPITDNGVSTQPPALRSQPPTPPLPQSASSRTKRASHRVGWIGGGLALLILSGIALTMFPTTTRDQPPSNDPNVETPSTLPGNASEPVPTYSPQMVITPPIASPATAPVTPNKGDLPAPPDQFHAPKVDRSPRDMNLASSITADSRLAYNSLAWFATAESRLTAAERETLKERLSRIDILIRNEQDADFLAAARLVDACIEASPVFKQSQNVRLAKLMFLDYAGEREKADAADGDPAFLKLGNDVLAYRVELMQRLRMDAMPLLEGIINSADTSKAQLAVALMERARLRVQFAAYEGTRSDIAAALDLSGENPAMRQWVQAESDELKRAKPEISR